MSTAHQWTVFGVSFVVTFVLLIAFALAINAFSRKHRAQARARWSHETKARQEREAAAARTLSQQIAAARSIPPSTSIANRPLPRRQPAPRNPDLPRVSCPVCHRMITVNKDGTLRAHGNGCCTGSGRRMFDHVIREIPFG